MYLDDKNSPIIRLSIYNDIELDCSYTATMTREVDRVNA
jgi:hypothetical protein